MTMQEPQDDFEVDAHQVKAWLSAPEEIAFLDLREHGQYGEGHPFLAVPLPYSRLELEVRRLLPRRDVRIVLLDDADGVAELAARRLKSLGYPRLHKARGGAAGWAGAGFTLYQGVNVPSKTLGELVEEACATPHLTAIQLSEMRESGKALLHLDGRPLEEFRRMTVPGARCCPNAELGHRIPALVDDPETPVLVSCAGRTRSIIGAQSLIALGLPNPVYALENGTQGWELAGLALERGAERSYPEALSEAEIAASRARGREAIRRYGLSVVDEMTLDAWARDLERTFYCFDVRGAEDYAAGHHPLASHAPGGQLVQASDGWIAVRGARIALVDDTGSRAAMAALWLRAMGHDVTILDPDCERCEWTREAPHGLFRGPPLEVPGLAVLAPEDLPGLLAAGAQILDFRHSQDYRRGHIEGAIWAIRPRLGQLAPDPARPLVLIAEDPLKAALAAVDLEELGCAEIRYMPVDEASWAAAGLRVVESEGPSDAEAIDRLLFVHDRHAGNHEAMRAYLAWELGLVGQLDAQERAVFDLETLQPR